MPFGGALAPRPVSQAPDVETSRHAATSRVERVETTAPRDPSDPQRGGRIAIFRALSLGQQIASALAVMLRTQGVTFFEKPVRPAVLTAAIQSSLDRLQALPATPSPQA